MADQRYVAVLPISIPADPALSDLAVRIAAGVGTFMDRAGRCSPGIDAIAAQVGRSPSSVYRGLDELIARGHLTRHRRARLTAELAWTVAVSRHSETNDPSTADRSSQNMIGQKRGYDRSESGALRVDDRSAADRYNENCFNENKNEVKGDRSHDPNSNGQGNLDLDARERPDTPTPIRDSLTKWIGVPRDQLPPRS